ncbi:hypothetical protein ACJZL1_04855 [Wolbachia endosymbiont of Rhagoletis indifferens]|uniref:hypothetical protein n=1 Tax=Wolbachia endosymbiont of Rhagoletis indifferens TaxID=3383250 RepID=UPI003AF38695
MLDTVLLCHPSAQTLGSSLSAISSKTFFYASLLAHKQTFLDPSGLCCIASYDGLKIKKMENISSLLFWYL